MNLEELEKLWHRWGEFVRRRFKSPAEMKEKERIGDLLDKAFRQHEKPLIDEVLETGIRVESVWNFVNTADKYPRAIPILIKHLSRPYHHRVKEGIVRALAVKEAKGIANKAIITEYLKAPKDDFHYRWTFGNTMRVIVTEDDLDELIEIVLDESNGDSRDMFVRALAKLKSPKVREVLNELANDRSEMVATEAKKAQQRKRPAN